MTYSIQYSDGKLWAFPDCPERPTKDAYGNELEHLPVQRWKYEDEYKKLYEASIKNRVEFKPEYYRLTGAFGMTEFKLGENDYLHVDPLKEGEVYPCPAGYKIDKKCNISSCNSLGTCQHKNGCLGYAILLPIEKEEPKPFPERWCSHGQCPTRDGKMWGNCEVCPAPYLKDVKLNPSHGYTEGADTNQAYTSCLGKMNPNGYCDTCYQPGQSSSAQCGRLIPVVPSKPDRQLALQQLIEWCKHDDTPSILSAREVIAKAQSLLPVEQSNVESAWSARDELTGNALGSPNTTAKDYFTQTYKP